MPNIDDNYSLDNATMLRKEYNWSLLFADDLVLYAESDADLQQLLHGLLPGSEGTICIECSCE